MDLTAIILAAGKGTRMNSPMPKVLHEVCGRPVLAWVLDACRQAGCDRQIVVVGHQADRVRSGLGDAGRDVIWVLQAEQLGTAHAVMCCSEQLEGRDGPVLVLAGDRATIRPQTLRKIVDAHVAEQSACTLGTSVMPDPGRYGRIIRDDAGGMVGIVEYLDADENQRRIREVNISTYCFEAEALRSVLPRLDNCNAKGEYYLTDAVGLLASDGRKLAAVPAVPPEEALGINTPEQLRQAERIMSARLEAVLPNECDDCGTKE